MPTKVSRIGPRFYARTRSVVEKQSPNQTQQHVWVDPFKKPPHPKPNFRVLIRPAVFTLVVIVAGNYAAEAFVNLRTSELSTRAQRQSETAWIIWPMVGINVAVFILWRVFPSLVHRIGGLLIPYAPTPSQLIVNTFSHQEIWHLVFNQIAFYSFGSLVCDTVGREYFISLYLSAACVSSLASVSATQYFVSRGIYHPSQLTKASLGASGVVYALLTISAILYPDSGVGLLLLPVSFPIKYIVPSLCIFDTVGILSRWSRFDHVAHVCPPVLNAE